MAARNQGQKGKFNGVNRGVYISDNLPFLESLNDECVDLVCIDPPFAKNETFAKSDDQLKPELQPSELTTELSLLRSWGIENAGDAEDEGIAYPSNVGAGFKDVWSWEGDVHEAWLRTIERENDGVAKLIEATRSVHSESTAAYLCYMGIRLLEMKRVMKPTALLYLHCDHTANGYLRQLLDGVFGKGNFRNEIIWKSSNAGKGSQHAPLRWQNTVNTIFCYAKSPKARVKPWREPTEEEVPDRFPHVDETTKRKGERYHTRTPLLRTPSMDPRPNLCYEFKGFRPPYPYGWRLEKAEMERAWENGSVLLVNGKLERRIYQRDDDGIPIGNLWTDIPPVRKPETTGYRTQKPHALARRIIEASTNHEDDVVLDCFAGCAYTAVAAELVNRRWVACDINPRAWTVFKRQFNKPQLALLRCHDGTSGQQVFGNEPVVTVHGPKELPEGRPEAERKKPRTGKRTTAPPPRRFKVRASSIPDPVMLNFLLGISDWKAWCCGFAVRHDSGEIVETTRNFHLDHIDPISKEGTSNEIVNRAPLCPFHNARKGNRRIGLAELRVEIADAGEMLVADLGDLINLTQARQKANEFFRDYKPNANR